MPATPEPGNFAAKPANSIVYRIIGLTALAASLLLALLLLPRTKPQPLREIVRGKLELRKGVLFELGHTNPFTGYMVDYYPDHTPLSRSAVSAGLLNGLSESWYTNRQVQSREFFRNGISDGLREKWFPNGKRQSEAQIVAGKIEGTFRSWHDNGQLAELIEMRDGAPDGVALAYFPSGYLKAQTKVQTGKVLARKVWNDGEQHLADSNLFH